MLDPKKEQDFIDRFAGVAADSDYSRHAQLRATTENDIRAAAKALWEQRTRGYGLKEYGERVTEADVVEALLAKVEYYHDENHLVSVNYEGYWDMTDGLGLSSGLRKRMQNELFHKYLGEKRMLDGVTTVSNDQGVWLFRFEG